MDVTICAVDEIIYYQELGCCGYVEMYRLGYYVTEYADSACLRNPLYLRITE